MRPETAGSASYSVMGPEVSEMNRATRLLLEIGCDELARDHSRRFSLCLHKIPLTDRMALLFAEEFRLAHEAIVGESE